MTREAPAPRNPYIAGNPVGGSPAFIGRADVLRDVYSLLCDPQTHGLVLYGQRRIGKTSILQHLRASLPEHGPFRPVYFDLQDKASLPLGEVLSDLACAIAAELGLQPSTPEDDTEGWFRDVWLPSVLAKLANDASLVILFDEFDVIADVRKEQAASALFPYLRQLLDDTQGRLRLVFVIGRNIGDLANIAQALFKTLPAEHVSLLSREDASALIRLSEDTGALIWDQGARDAAWFLTNGHPYLLQNLCWHVWQECHAQDDTTHPANATAADVMSAVPRALQRAGNALEWLWSGLPPAGRVVASALAGAGAQAISDEELQRLLHESGARIVIRELRDAPRRLEEWDLIEPAEDGYRFRVELLRQWIAKNKPLSRVQKDLDSVEPRAEKLYAAAEAQYEAEELDAADDLLRKALAANPNHMRASELLAEILITKRQWAEARRLLEQLYENNPGAARGRLVQVLLALVDAAQGEDDRLALLDQVLSLQKHPIAEAARRKIWRERGDRARTAGRLEEAIDAYREASEPQLEKQLADDLRRRELDASLRSIAVLEKRGEYGAAHERLRRIAERFQGLRDWGPELARLEAAASLDASDQKATQAELVGDKDAALQALLEIIARNPRYKNATERLHTLVTGVNVNLAIQALEMEKRGRAADAAAATSALVRRTAALTQTFKDQEREWDSLLAALRAALAKAESAERATNADLSTSRRELSLEQNKVAILEVNLRDERDTRAQAESRATNLAEKLDKAGRYLKESEKRLEQALVEKRAVLAHAQDRAENLEEGSQLALQLARDRYNSLDEARRALLTSRRQFAAGLGSLLAGVSIAFAVTYTRLEAARVSIDDVNRKLAAGANSGELGKTKDDLRSAQEQLAKFDKMRRDLAVEGLLHVEEANVRPSVRAGSSSACTESQYNRKFLDSKTCFIEVDLSIRNNAANLVAPTGALCVKIFRPDGTMATGRADYVSPSPDGPCTFGLPLNIAGNDKQPKLLVASYEELFQVKGYWGSDAGTSFIGRLGTYRVEVYWQQQKIGETTFEIFAPEPKTTPGPKKNCGCAPSDLLCMMQCSAGQHR